MPTAVPPGRLHRLFHGQPVNSRLRWPAAACGTVTSAATVPLIVEQWQEAVYRGLIFAAFALACLSLSGLLVVADLLPVYVAASLLCRLGVLGLVFTTLTAGAGPDTGAGTWSGPSGVVSLIAATGMAILCGLVVASRRRPGRPGTVTPRRAGGK